MSIADKARAIAAALKAEEHRLAAAAEEVFAHFHQDGTELASEAHVDEMQVAQAAEPVVAEAETDAKQLAEQAAADVKDVTEPASAPEPPATPAA